MMPLSVVYPTPGEDGMPARPRERQLMPREQRRSPAEWGEVFRPFGGLFSLPLYQMDEALENAPDAFWATFVQWWENACEPLDLPAPEIYRPPSIDERPRGRRRPVVEDDDDDPEAEPVAPRLTVEDLARRDDPED